MRPLQIHTTAVACSPALSKRCAGTSLSTHMVKHPDSTGTLEIALAAREKGYVAIPIHPGTKVPKVKWKRWQHEMPPEEVLRAWFRTRCNIAIITTGLVEFDCDDPKQAELVLEKCGDTPHKLRTPSGGMHLGFRRRKGSVVANQVDIKGLRIDIRTDGGLEMIPDSQTDAGRYEWLGEGLKPISELPLAKIGWTRERKRRQLAQAIEAKGDLDFLEYRAVKWLEKVPGAVSGQHGHSVTFRVACKLTHYFQLDFDRALRLMLLFFNPKCTPPWSEKELMHKVEDALKKGT